MSGFYGIYSLDKNHPENIPQHFFSYQFDNMVNEEFRQGDFTYGRSVIDKFTDDRSIWEDDEHIILFEGICYNNRSKLISDFVIDLYKKQSENLAKDIDGQFSGFIFDKLNKKLVLFNDHLASKPIYYYLNSEKKIFIFSSELKALTAILDSYSISIKYNLPGIYSFLSFGYYLGDHTPVDGVKRMGFSNNCIFDITDFTLSSNTWFNYEKKQNFSLSKSDILNTIENLLTNSIQKEWLKDNQYNYDHYAMLSGGLDSRVNSLIAYNSGWGKSIFAITFAESNSNDDKIARKIALKNGFKHAFQPLDNGMYLAENLDEYVYANDGMVNLLGSSHGYFTLSKLDHSAHGLLHTGQIGDLLFGSYSLKVSDIKQRIMSELNNKNYFLKDKFQYFENIIDQYQGLSYEQFVYEQKAINGALNGDRTCSHFADMASPFYDKELIKYCLTIPDKFKQNESIYIEWMSKYHPYLTKYKWERAGVNPSNIQKVKIGTFVKRGKVAIMRKMGIHTGMNPFEKWVKSNPFIMENLDKIFRNNLDYVTEPIIRKELEYWYTNSTYISDKMKVVTLLISLKMFFA